MQQLLLRPGSVLHRTCMHTHLTSATLPLPWLHAWWRPAQSPCPCAVSVGVCSSAAPCQCRTQGRNVHASATDADSSQATPQPPTASVQRRRRISTQSRPRPDASAASGPGRTRVRRPRQSTAPSSPDSPSHADTEPANISHAHSVTATQLEVPAQPTAAPLSADSPSLVWDAEALRTAQAAGLPSATATDHEAAFHAAVTALGLSQTQVDQMRSYLDYMLETNKVMNLTAVRDPNEALTRHLVDSLALLPVIEQHAATQQGSTSLRLIDVGTGAGLPGMVLAAARPQWRVTLLDTLRKRCDFLKRAAETAGLQNVEVMWSRAEDGARKQGLREAFDVSVARAVADSRVLAELCLPYVRRGGVWVAAKGPDPEAEVSGAARAIQLLGGAPASVARVCSFSSDGQRTAVVVRKAKATPQQYPRAPGTPNKTPL